MSVKIEKGMALSGLSLTPLIDIVFLLLIFFLVASRFEEEERELKVTLPAASEAKPLTEKPKELFVNVDEQGGYFVQGKVVNAAELEQILKKVAELNPGNQSVVIRADRKASWEAVSNVMNLCNKANITDYRPAFSEGG